MQISCTSTVVALQERVMCHVMALLHHVKLSTSANFYPKWEVLRNISSTASSHASSSISSGSSSVDPTIIIKKQFFLQGVFMNQWWSLSPLWPCFSRSVLGVLPPTPSTLLIHLQTVHPDFFQQHPREQNVNSENLKVLNNFFETSSQRSSSLASTISPPFTRIGASPRDLVFYVKTRALPPRTSSTPNFISLPSRVVVPLNDRVFHSLHEILSRHCELGSSLPSPSPSPAPAGPDHRSSIWDHIHEQAHDDWRWAWRRPCAEDEDEGWAPFLDRFVAHLQRRETKRGEGQKGRRGDGLGTLQDRKEAAKHMEATGARICAKWGFESVQLHR